ncbi:hypothetical protein IE53DRAFT_6972 [Violaceomyces palustris]|uniref:Uncharacterized protein n=1 Tax=Violaceomyces palustris TaxID=1673888 RepID=A0ACD0P2C4_9BASI|nr:hypothetical protein IE53DRAFT_6972 [Violaceomyces palustris]
MRGKKGERVGNEGGKRGLPPMCRERPPRSKKWSFLFPPSGRGSRREVHFSGKVGGAHIHWIMGRRAFKPGLQAAESVRLKKGCGTGEERALDWPLSDRAARPTLHPNRMKHKRLVVLETSKVPEGGGVLFTPKLAGGSRAGRHASHACLSVCVRACTPAVWHILIPNRSKTEGSCPVCECESQSEFFFSYVGVVSPRSPLPKASGVPEKVTLARCSEARKMRDRWTQPFTKSLLDKPHTSESPSILLFFLDPAHGGANPIRPRV